MSVDVEPVNWAAYARRVTARGSHTIPWRVGVELAGESTRMIYAEVDDDPDVPIGSMGTAELTARVVDAINGQCRTR